MQCQIYLYRQQKNDSTNERVRKGCMFRFSLSLVVRPLNTLHCLEPCIRCLSKLSCWMHCAVDHEQRTLLPAMATSRNRSVSGSVLCAQWNYFLLFFFAVFYFILFKIFLVLLLRFVIIPFIFSRPFLSLLFLSLLRVCPLFTIFLSSLNYFFFIFFVLSSVLLRGSSLFLFFTSIFVSSSFFSSWCSSLLHLLFLFSEWFLRLLLHPFLCIFLNPSSSLHPLFSFLHISLSFLRPFSYFSFFMFVFSSPSSSLLHFLPGRLCGFPYRLSSDAI